ncbi:hypothetical protein EG68_11031 [Paragonimus skrjabini miyazakii]|uniref:EF-hand domain-containing protein n=1 Tax=Paragonimus skrjabini miyazakii TaxID=59628 RepID=A0A8S9YM98_9TREM|nr:hypothetical protein EG68_11031 [Paragonimus skrjabini miyazakii]
MSWFGYRRTFSRIIRGYSRIRNWSPVVLSVFAAGASYLGYLRYITFPERRSVRQKSVTSMHERRFRDFASVEWNGVLFMTPTDFLNSLVQDMTSSRKIAVLSDREVQLILNKTPSKLKGSSALFRGLQNNGLLSFTEYLFLLQILTKPISGFEIAFKMLDMDMSGSVDAREFATLNHVVASSEIRAVDAPNDLVLSKADEFNTTLMTHFFGKDHNACLTLKDFIRFMYNLQKESLEVEFHNHAMDSDTISAEEFARILIRHTSISSTEYKGYMDRLHLRLPAAPTIPFAEFLKFFQFLNSLDDFSLAMKMYTLAERPISLSEFRRAVKACTGYKLDMSVLKTVFALFDENEDGCLSYQEFIQKMRERHSRGLQDGPHGTNREEVYRLCMAREIRSALI